jgi:hypothetical protein
MLILLYREFNFIYAYYEAKMTIREALKLFEKLGMHIREGKDTTASFYHEGRLIVRTKVPHKMGTPFYPISFTTIASLFLWWGQDSVTCWLQI